MTVRETWESIYNPSVVTKTRPANSRTVQRGKSETYQSLQFFESGAGAKLAAAYGVDLATITGAREVTQRVLSVSRELRSQMDPATIAQLEAPVGGPAKARAVTMPTNPYPSKTNFMEVVDRMMAGGEL